MGTKQLRRLVVAVAVVGAAAVVPVVSAAAPPDDPTTTSSTTTSSTTTSSTTTTVVMPSTTSSTSTTAVSTSTTSTTTVASGTIRGRVTGPGGTPIAGAVVTATLLNTPSGTSISVTTSTDGAYTLVQLANGRYSLRFAGPAGGGWVAESYPAAVPVESGATVDAIDAELAPSGSISGRVTDADGAPLVGVPVVANGPSLGVAVTGVDGTYTVTGLAAGEHRVNFQPNQRTGYVAEFYDDVVSLSAATPVRVTAGSTTAGIDAALARGGSIAGTVTDESGRPVTGVRVHANGSGFPLSAVSRTDGTYVLGGLAAGSYRVRFDAPSGRGLLSEHYDDAPDSRTAMPLAVAAGATTAGIDAVLSPEASISGRVLDDTGTPVADSSVQVSVAGAASLPSGYATTGADGSYRVGGLRAGSYVVEFRQWVPSPLVGEFYDDAPSAAEAAPVVLAAGAAATGIDAELATGATITGRVVGPDGTPVVGASVSTALGSDYRLATTDRDGNYAIVGVRTGSVRVFFTAPAGSGLASEFYDDAATSDTATLVVVSAREVTSGIDAQLELGGAIAGRVTAVDGTPVFQAWIVLEALDGSVSPGQFTDADGQYLVDGLRPGRYRVRVAPEFSWTLAAEYYDGSYTAADATPVSVAADAITEGIDVELDVGGSIAGRVIDADGRPIVGAMVSVLDAARWDLTDSDGRYLVVGLPKGANVVRFEPPDGSGLQPEFYDDRPSAETATPVAVTLGARTDGIDAVLTAQGPASQTPPSPPLAVTAAPGDGNVTVSWSSPDDDGGSPVTGYEVRVEPPATGCVTTATSCTVAGLINGTTYRFTVTASNAVGAGPASDAVEATPRTAPSRVQRLQARTVIPRAIVLSWRPPASDGGAAVTGYVVQRSRDGRTWITEAETTATQVTVRDLPRFSLHAFRVAAVNEAGRAPWSHVVGITLW